MIQRGTANRLFYSVLWALCWVFCEVWFRFRYIGRGNVPAIGPVLLVSNHQSHLDPVLVGVACPRQVRALARHELFFWPFSWLIRALGAVPVDRERGALGGIKTTLKLLKDGQVVLVFPEGTRTPHGNLQPFHPGFCVLARRSGATIVPVAIDGAFDAFPRGAHFPRPGRITLTFGQPVTKEQYDGLTDEQITESVRGRIALALGKSLLT